MSEVLPRGTGCRDGHDGRSGPGEHRELGAVPSRTSTWIGAVLVTAVALALWLWLPGTRVWVIAGLGTWWVVVLALQAALGHRRSCLVPPDRSVDARPCGRPSRPVRRRLGLL